MEKELREKVQELLQKPLNENDGKTFEKKSEIIANNLFNNFGIKCGEKTFYFTEIEFYYYNKKLYLKDKEQYKWQKVTYPRTDKNVGDFLYHLSGIDICFDSHYDGNDEKETIFGGILVRSIKDKSGNVTSGPLTCKDVILNSCNNEMPKLELLNPTEDISLKSIKRYLGKKDMNENKIDGDWKLCFYEETIDWKKTSEKDVFNKENGTIYHRSKDYSDRFNL